MNPLDHVHRVSLPPTTVSSTSMVEAQLAKLYAAIPTHLADSSQGVSRLSTLTFIALCASKDDIRAAHTIVEDLTSTHPARIIMIVPHRRGHPRIDMELAMAWDQVGPANSIVPIVYSEEITLHVYGPATHHLMSILSPLLIPDIPVALLYAGHPSLATWLTPEILSLSTVVFIDSNTYHAAGTALFQLFDRMPTTSETTLVDFAWIRTLAWRLAIAKIFDLPDVSPAVGNIYEIALHLETFRHSSDAYLTAGWLLSRFASIAPKSSSQPIPHLHFSHTHTSNSDDALVSVIIKLHHAVADRIEIVAHQDSLITTIWSGKAELHQSVLPRTHIPYASIIDQSLIGHQTSHGIFLASLETAAMLSHRREHNHGH